MKGCQVYKTDKFYKIVTVYKQESWAYISSKPIYIVPLETSIEELSEKIFKSLKSSRNIKESEEDTFWLGSELIKELKERSFDSLYTKSKSCSIWFDKSGMFSRGSIEIKPNQYLGKSKGLVAVDENSIKIKYEKGKEDDIAKQVINILD